MDLVWTDLALRSSGIRGEGSIMCTMDFVDLLHNQTPRKDLQGVVFASPAFEISSLSPDSVAWKEKFLKRFGRSPSYVAAYAYDTARILVETALRDQKVTTETLKKHFPWKGVVGNIELDESNDLSTTLVTAIISSNGEPQVVQ